MEPVRTQPKHCRLSPSRTGAEEGERITLEGEKRHYDRISLVAAII
jgi:hypothetical protein